MTFLTDFADQAVVLPLVLAVMAVLTVRGRWRTAALWLGVICVTFGAVLLLKLGFIACSSVFVPWSIRSPSGHTAAAAMVAGGLTALVTGRLPVVLLVSLLSAGVIGMSRVVLGFHSLPEVTIGAVVGLTGAGILSWLAGPPGPRRPVSALLVAAAVAILLHGLRLPAEAIIWEFARGALDFLPPCRVARAGVL